MKKRALISVSDKNGIVEFAREIEKLGFEIISTGGTFTALEKAGIKVIGISDITGFPECLDGRVKTLHPNVHAGILAMRANAEHMEQLEKLNINTIDLVVVNLYPFKATISKPNVTLADAIENIDIGGPTMLRSSAKNYQDVYVVVDPLDYQKVLDDIKNGTNSIDLKFYLSYKVFQHTAVYDTLIANFMQQKLGIEFPEQVSFAYEKAQDMRYGENPHQKAVFYRDMLKYEGALAFSEQLHGKELSYNNINDTNGALDLLREFTEPACIAVKHANPCGVGVGADCYEAYMNSYNADKISIFGGIVATNCVVDEKTAIEMNKIFIEIIIAKDFTKEALAVLKQKANIRLLKLDSINAPMKPFTYDMKKVVGGLLVQDYNSELFDENELVVVTDLAPTSEQLKMLKFAMKVVKHTKSNAIVVANGNATTGIGAGQTNRIWACKQAIEHSEGKQEGGVLASDAFFPFPDCVEECNKAGIKAIIQPGGSRNDNESIAKCNEYGIAMVFCGKRHFKH